MAAPPRLPPPPISALLRQISEESKRGGLSPREKAALKDMVVAGDYGAVQRYGELCCLFWSGAAGLLGKVI